MTCTVWRVLSALSSSNFSWRFSLAFAWYSRSCVSAAIADTSCLFIFVAMPSPLLLSPEYVLHDCVSDTQRNDKAHHHTPVHLKLVHVSSSFRLFVCLFVSILSRMRWRLLYSGSPIVRNSKNRWGYAPSNCAGNPASHAPR